jgi:DNA-binding LacI/PurR family transcriptional regulator
MCKFIKEKLKMQKKTTMDDIARELHVSRSLVSRALSDEYGVNDDTRTKIRLAALEMGYNFSKVKRLKKTKAIGKTENICVVIPRMDFIDENFYGKIVFGIEKSLNQRKIDFSLSIIEGNTKQEDEFLISVRRIKCDGIIIIGGISYKNIIALISSGFPTVMVDTAYGNFKNDRITSNGYWGCYDAVEYLINSGHRKIGFAGSLDYSDPFTERVRGFRECIEHYKHLQVEAVEIISQYGTQKEPFDLENARQLILQDNRPTAIMCANDPTAFKLYDFIGELGLKIPDDISIIGFDNCEKCEYVVPKLSSVNVPKCEIGKAAVELLLNRIADKDLITRDLKFDAALVIRDSVKILNKK